ncbi:MAG TPA: hypothetical protein VEZ70_04130 [Allosphingosinicella sp.]|nr:hypothetical protein [Allosphingosinicella sp.]
MHFQPITTAPAAHPAMPNGWIHTSVEQRMVKLSLGERLTRLQRSWLLPFLIGAGGGVVVWLPGALASL